MASILSLSGKAPVVYKNDVKLYTENKRVAFCANSGYQFSPALLSENGVLLVDESDQVFRYLFEDLCNDDGIRPIILSSLEAQFASAISDGSALFMSADITGKDIDYILEIAPKNAKIEVIINVYKPKRCQLNFSTDSEPDGLVNLLIEKLNQGIPCFVIDDLKNGFRGCKTLAEYIRRQWRVAENDDWCDEILEVNADTSKEEEVIRALSNINEESLNYRLIICSPSVTGGLSITNGKFAGGVFGFYNGILLDDDASQSLGRVRGATSVHVWAAVSGFNTEASGAITPAEVHNFYYRNYESRNKFILGFGVKYNVMSHEWESAHWNLFCKNAAYRNLVMARLRMRIKDKLIDDGFQIIEVKFGESEETEEKLKNCWWMLQEDEVNAIADASLLSKQEEEVLRFKQKEDGLTRQEKLSLTKTHLLNTFGEKIIESATYEHKNGSELTGYAALAMLNWNGKLEKGLYSLYRIKRPIEDSFTKDLQAEEAQMKHGDDVKRFPGDIKWHTRKYKFWEHYEISTFLDPSREWYPSHYRNLTDKLKADPLGTKDVLGFNPSKIKQPGQIFTALIESIGLKVETIDVKIGGVPQKWKAKKISEKSWNLAIMFIEHRETLRLEREKENAQWQEKCKQEQETREAKQRETAIEKSAEAIKKKFEKHCYDETIFEVESLKDCVQNLSICEDAETLELFVMGWQSLFREKSKLIDFLLELASKFLPGKESEIKEWMAQEKAESEQLELVW